MRGITHTRNEAVDKIQEDIVERSAKNFLLVTLHAVGCIHRSRQEWQVARLLLHKRWRKGEGMRKLNKLGYLCTMEFFFELNNIMLHRVAPISFLRSWQAQPLPRAGTVQHSGCPPGISYTHTSGSSSNPRRQM